ncbi:Hypothetical protein PHPALM_20849, partial [Phytophthora palmivora]
MRLYHVLLATAAALVASNNGFAAADNCYIVPQETEEPVVTATPAPVTQNSNAGSDASNSDDTKQGFTPSPDSDTPSSVDASQNNDDDTKQGLTPSSGSGAPSSDDASQKTDVASSAETGGEADTPLTFTEAPKSTTAAPTVSSSSGSGSAPTTSNNST